MTKTSAILMLTFITGCGQLGWPQPDTPEAKAQAAEAKLESLEARLEVLTTSAKRADEATAYAQSALLHTVKRHQGWRAVSQCEAEVTHREQIALSRWDAVRTTQLARDRAAKEAEAAIANALRASKKAG